MHVVLLNQYYAPDEAATAQLLADLGEALAAAGHGVTDVCCNRAYADPGRRYPARERIGVVDIRRARTSSFGRGSKLGRICDYTTFLIGATLHLLSCPRPDVIVSLTTPPFISLLGLLVARLRGAKAVFWSMDVYPELAFALGAIREKSVPGRILSSLARRVLRSSDLVVALGETMAARLRDMGATRVGVVHNWSDRVPCLPRRTSAGAPFVVLYSGNLGLAHEFETVLDAAAALQPESEIVFDFAGSGPRFAETEQRARARGLRNVGFRPPVAREQLGENLASGDVHLITLRAGLQGLLVPSKVYGILAAGRPILYVGPDEGEIFDIVTESRAGVRIANGDAGALVQAIRAYRSDPDACVTAGQAARSAYDAHYSKERSTARFRAMIESLV